MEEMVGPKNWRGPGLGSERARARARGEEAGEDEDADEDADQENEEEEVMEEVEEDVARGAAESAANAEGCRGGPPSGHRGVGVAAPLAASAPRQRGLALREEEAGGPGYHLSSSHAARFL